MTTRAQSEAVGVILLTAVVVLTVGTVGAVVFAEVNTAETTRADLAVSVADDGVAVSHNGGESVPFSELRIVVRHGNDTWRPSMNESGVVRGDGDDQFQPSERWVWRQPLDTGEITTVRVFDRRTGAMLAKSRRYPTSGAELTPTATAAGGTVTTGTATATSTSTATPPPTGTATATPAPTPEPDTTPPSVTVDAPNGGERFQGGDTTTIQWSATDAESGVDSVDIAYSTDGGASWDTVVTDTANDGSYDWTVPTDNTTDALIRVTATDAASNTANDTSDAPFTVDSAPPSVDAYTGVTADKDTDNVTVGTFDASDNIGLGRVEFTVYDGATAIGSKTVTLSGTTANLSSVEMSTSGIQPNNEYTVEAVLYDDLGYSVMWNETVSSSATLKSNEVAYDDANGNGQYDDSETTYKESDLQKGFDRGSVDLVVAQDFSSKNNQGFDIKANSVTVDAGVTVTSEGDVLLQGTDSVRLDGATIDSAGQVKATAQNGELSAADGTITVDTDSVLTLTGSGDVDVSGATISGRSEVTVISTNGEIDARDADAAVDGDSVLQFDSAAETRLEGATLTARATPSDVTNAKMKVTADDVTTDTATALYDLNGNGNVLYWTNGPSGYQDTNPQPGEVQGQQP